MTRKKRRGRLTVEQLGVDRLDVRELQRAGILGESLVSLTPALLWPRIDRMRAYQYLIQLELRHHMVPQRILVSWTPCHYGGARPFAKSALQYSLGHWRDIAVASVQAIRSMPANARALGLGGTTRPASCASASVELHHSLCRFRSGHEECISAPMNDCGAGRRF